MPDFHSIPDASQLVAVTGLPRAGSTLLCQLLLSHPDIAGTGHSSPLCQTLVRLRAQLSDNEFLLAQLDVDADAVQARLLAAFRGFVAGWLGNADRSLVIDKSRCWLQHLELALLLDPRCRMLVCVRELGQVLGSIEAQHQRTLLLDFPDHLAGLGAYARADKLLAEEGVVGGPLRAIEAMQDRPSELQQRVYYVVFEHLMAEPVAVMADIAAWLGIAPSDLDPGHLPVQPRESDSHYRLKYPHQTRACLVPPAPHPLPARIEAALRERYGWFYHTFYPGRTAATRPEQPAPR